MANVKTFDLIVHFKGYTRQYTNISRVAVNRYIKYHQENPDYEYSTV